MLPVGIPKGGNPWSRPSPAAMTLQYDPMARGPVMVHPNISPVPSGQAWKCRLLSGSGRGLWSEDDLYGV
jgi:hypothetical protein